MSMLHRLPGQPLSSSCGADPDVTSILRAEGVARRSTASLLLRAAPARWPAERRRHLGHILRPHRTLWFSSSPSFFSSLVLHHRLLQRSNARYPRPLNCAWHIHADPRGIFDDMPDLPYDVKKLIVVQLKHILEQDNKPNRFGRRDPGDLAPYASISREWNAVVEHESFSSITVDAEDMDSFKQAMGRDAGRRRSITRHIVLQAPIAGSGFTERTEFESSVCFSRAIADFFKIIAGWSDANDAVSANGRMVTLELVVSTDAKGSFPAMKREPARHDKHKSHYMRYTRKTLQHVRWFSRLEVHDHRRNLWPTDIVRVMAAMEGLRSCELNAFDDDFLALDKVRQQYRNDLGRALRQIPHTCQSIHCNFEDDNYIYGRPTISWPALDRLCVDFRQLSTGLKHLHITNLRISPALLWPGLNEHSNALPFWSSLETIHVGYGSWDPYGDSFVATSANGWDSSHNTVSLGALHVAASHAARRMPKLCEMVLQLDDSGFSYEVEQRLEVKRDDRRGCVATWDLRPSVELSADVLGAWGVADGMLEVSLEEEGNGHTRAHMKAAVRWWDLPTA